MIKSLSRTPTPSFRSIYLFTSTYLSMPMSMSRYISTSRYGHDSLPQSLPVPLTLGLPIYKSLSVYQSMGRGINPRREVCNAKPNGQDLHARMAAAAFCGNWQTWPACPTVGTRHMWPFGTATFAFLHACMATSAFLCACFATSAFCQFTPTKGVGIYGVGLE